MNAVRPAGDLEELDLSASQVWRFVTSDECGDLGVDESYVVAQAEAPGVGLYGSYMIAAQYSLMNGSTLPGIVQVDCLGRQIEFTPSTLFASGKSVDALGSGTEARLQRLLKTTGAQPIGWRLNVCLSGEAKPRSAAIAKPGLGQVLGLLFKLVRLRLHPRDRGRG
jgi:hypothetical protein